MRAYSEVEFSPIRFVVAMIVALMFCAVAYVATDGSVFMAIIAFFVQIFAMRPAREGGPWVWERYKSVDQ